MRSPDLIIDGGNGPQTLRWHLFRWRGIQVALHRWLQSDSDRALHDHPAGNVSILLTGCYREWFNHSWQPAQWKLRLPLIPYYRSGGRPHRVELHKGPLWSLWIRFAPWREWGFWCGPKRWVHWTDYVKNRDNVSGIGNGCG